MYSILSAKFIFELNFNGYESKCLLGGALLFGFVFLRLVSPYRHTRRSTRTISPSRVVVVFTKACLHVPVPLSNLVYAGCLGEESMARLQIGSRVLIIPIIVL